MKRHKDSFLQRQSMRPTRAAAQGLCLGHGRRRRLSELISDFDTCNVSGSAVPQLRAAPTRPFEHL
jgi:hypothetical protein